MATTTTNNTESLESSYRKRIEQGLRTVQAWENADLLMKCRAALPWDDLRAADGPYSDPSKDAFLHGDLLFLQRLCRYFQKSMTWVNQPVCPTCQTNQHQTLHTTRGPLTPEERQGQASRVEVYHCSHCQTETTFPRYNNVATLWETRHGRCGEYANLFGLTCRSVGFRVRYTMDWTDHVWVECECVDTAATTTTSAWIMADGCEGVVNEPAMYEHGWSKSLNMVVGVAIDHVIDVTPRYTRQWVNNDFLARRRAITTSEAAGAAVLQQINATLQQQSNPKQLASLQTMLRAEQAVLEALQFETSWGDDGSNYQAGRISGSMEWKVSRGEVGKNKSTNQDENNNNKNDNKNNNPAYGRFHVEQFWSRPMTNTDTKLGNCIQIQSSQVTIYGTVIPRIPDALTTVVFNDLGCILACRAFCTLDDLKQFCETVPDGRFIVIQGNLPSPSKDKAVSISRLPGFEYSVSDNNNDDDAKKLDGIVYVGQIGVSPAPTWTHCASPAQDCILRQHPNSNTTATDTNNPQQEDIRLATHENTQAGHIVGRLPESSMPLATQLLATHAQKRLAFTNFSDRAIYAGYTTRPGAPVYLLGPRAFPLRQCSDWATFLNLPSVLVSDKDVGIVEDDGKGGGCQEFHYEVPLDVDAFVQKLGPQLLTQTGQTLETGTALANKRLVGLYFSAHWCGPCRQFTPMLAEFYQHLQDEFPTHGLELVFVSSDRDQASFDQYFRSSMPWLAVPFSNLAQYKQMLSFQYGVQGIPCLVILDAVSGQIVSDGKTSRREVMQACQRGETAIEDLLEDWCQRVPPSSLEMLQLLQVSCQETSIEDEQQQQDPKIVAYLERSPEQDTKARVQQKFKELVAKGVSANEAAAKAIGTTAMEPTNDLFEKDSSSQLVVSSVSECAACVSDLSQVVTTCLKYAENARKTPHNPKFRQFKLSNKVADRITRIPRGLEFLESTGLQVLPISEDFVVNLPVGLDLDVLCETLNGLLEQESSS